MGSQTHQEAQESAEEDEVYETLDVAGHYLC